jgi:hypothetical protein
VIAQRTPQQLAAAEAVCAEAHAFFAQMAMNDFNPGIE